ncbi:hypothetical protein HN903_02735 [archaeon]|nr:hypothetical protein [archaeon]MBT7128649.1 hypothetical protein [archaeon]
MGENSKLKIDRPRGYREGSKTSRTLDFLAKQGIDGIKIKTPHVYGACFLPLYTIEGAEYFIDDVKYRCGGKYVTDELMEIDVISLMGEEIKQSNPKLKISDDFQDYPVLRIKDSDLNPGILFREESLIF